MEICWVLRRLGAARDGVSSPQCLDEWHALILNARSCVRARVRVHLARVVSARARVRVRVRVRVRACACACASVCECASVRACACRACACRACAWCACAWCMCAPVWTAPRLSPSDGAHARSEHARSRRPEGSSISVCTACTRCKYRWYAVSVTDADAAEEWGGCRPEKRKGRERSRPLTGLRGGVKRAGEGVSRCSDCDDVGKQRRTSLEGGDGSRG
eukprot:4925710-Pleurochrysis_carterae.AAC.3